MATYQELTAQIEQLTREAEAIRKKEKAEAVSTVREQIKQYDIQFEDLRDVLSANLAGQAGRRKSTSKVAPKYRHPATGKTWTGRGRTPLWMAEAMKSGKAKEEFLIE